MYARPFVLGILKTERLRWLFHATALMEYCTENGHCNIPIDTVYTCNINTVTADKGSFRYVGHLGKWLAHEIAALARDEQNSRAHGLLTRTAHHGVPERRSFIDELVSQG